MSAKVWMMALVTLAGPFIAACLSIWVKGIVRRKEAKQQQENDENLARIQHELSVRKDKCKSVEELYETLLDLEDAVKDYVFKRGLDNRRDPKFSKVLDEKMKAFHSSKRRNAVRVSDSTSRILDDIWNDSQTTRIRHLRIIAQERLCPIDTSDIENHYDEVATLLTQLIPKGITALKEEIQSLMGVSFLAAAEGQQTRSRELVVKALN